MVRLPQLSQKGKRVKIEFFLNSGAAAILSYNKKRKNIRIFIVSTELFFYNAV